MTYLPQRDEASGIALIPVAGGSFAMGDMFGDGFDNEQPVHEVTLADFAIGPYPVTQGEWTRIMGDNPAAFPLSPNHPVENVTWADVQQFLERLNGLRGGGFRLPTEAEWEYAARSGGLKEKWAGANDIEAARASAWYDENANKSTQPVGTRRANGLGLYDMSGNVYEFVADTYHDEAYRHHARHNPCYLGSGEDCVIRGGSWYTYLLLTRCSDRSCYGRGYRDNYVGFRIARSL